MTNEELDEFLEYAFEVKHNRDYYSRAKIIELLVGKVIEISKRDVTSQKNKDANPKNLKTWE